jgi:hypothetical protein
VLRELDEPRAALEGDVAVLGFERAARVVFVTLLAFSALATAAPAFADAPGAGDNQCRGATGNGTRLPAW